MNKPLKEYLYNFVGGGWNSEFAHTKAQAIKQAKNRWAGSTQAGHPQLEVDTTSFRISTPKDYQNLMSLFY
jgi:hypothetical protein